MDDVIRQARKMRAFFLEECSGRNPLKVNIEKLERVISEKTGVNIIRYQSPKMSELRGMMIRLENGDALVLISDKITECWKRFTFIKEISHLFLTPSEDDFNTDTYEQAKCLVDIANGDQKLFKKEVSGIVAAMELLIPEGNKGTIAHMAQVEHKNLYQISSTFMVPQKFMEHRMTEWGIQIIAS